MFHPIAIVGRSTILPQAQSPEQLWKALVEGQDFIRSVPSMRWGIRPDLSLRRSNESDPDRSWSDRGGYVVDPELDFDGVSLDTELLNGLDPLFHWAIHCSNQAMRQVKSVNPKKTGVVLGNLSFPSVAMAKLSQQIWFG